MITPFLAAHNVTKRFPGVVALQDVELSVEKGEVVSVIGENGAGKSTLMKILAGVLPMDEGTLTLDEMPVKWSSARDASAAGIFLIHQELSLLSNLSVGANIFLGREPQRAGWINRRKIAKKTEEVLERIGLNLSPDTLVKTLPIGQRQMVEIARALATEARLIIMDEPTSSLAEGEVRRLFEVINDLKEEGTSILYISHRLREVEEISDRVVVLMDGRNAAHLVGSDINRDTMVRSMVGRELSGYYLRRDRASGDRTVEVQELSTYTRPQCKLTFSLRAGEIVGLAGLVGSGRTELLRSLFGVDPPREGNIMIDGKEVSCTSPREAMDAGIALVPEDRGHQGLVLEMLVDENMVMASLNRRSTPLLRGEWVRSFSSEMIDRMRIDAARQKSVTRNLSGGNQQKVVLGKWLLIGPKLLLMDEPTRGIDVGAKQEIYLTMEALAEEGMAILFASSEMEELLGIADRVLVMHEGTLAGELKRDLMSEESIMFLATGKGRGEA